MVYGQARAEPRAGSSRGALDWLVCAGGMVGQVIIIAIDPGPTTSGLVVYDSETHRVTEAHKGLTEDEALAALSFNSHADVVAIERVESYGISGNSLLQTAELAGSFRRSALDLGLDVRWVTRREVCRHLHVSGGSKDAQVRQRLIYDHGGDVKTAKGVKAEPGPLYGVAGHAWAALAVAVAAVAGCGRGADRWRSEVPGVVP